MLGARVLGTLTEEVEDVAGAAGEFVDAEPERHEVDAQLPGDVRLTGTVAQVRGDHLTRIGFSRLSAKHRLAAWLELLALTATDPSRPWRAAVVGARGRSVLGPVSGPWATQVLADLVLLRRTGLREPLPFAARTSAQYAVLRHAGHPLAREQLRELDKTWTMDRDSVYEQYFGPGVNLSRPDGRAVAPGRGTRLARRAEPVRHPGPAGVHTLAQLRGADVTLTATAAPPGRTSTSAVHSRRGPPCWRPAPGRARRTRSPPSPPATWPRARWS